jgi:hypothetical protein
MTTFFQVLSTSSSIKPNRNLFQMEKHVKLLEGMENLHDWIWGYISRKEKDVQGQSCAHSGGI